MSKLQGRQTHMGYTAWIGKMDEEPSVLVDMLWKAGAVFYVKTSVPQSLMVCETINNVVGRTTNPRNDGWSCGGSSGGEGAIVGFRGAVIGIGTDIGKLRVAWPIHHEVIHESDMNRWLNPRPCRVQLSLRATPKSRTPPLRQDGQQHGRPRDNP